jgi:glutamyl-tRNA synthetase
VGYLPWAIDNYLSLLGWSYDDKTEFFSRDELIRHFTLERINSSPASFDPKKLWAVQDHYMARLSTAEKLALMLPFLMKAGLVADPPPADAVETVRRVIEAAGDRLKVAGDILAYADFFLVDQPVMDPDAVAKRLATPTARQHLEAFAARLAAVEPFEPAALEEALKATAEAAGAKVGDLVHPIRVAVTGRSVGPGLYDCLAILGRERVLSRMSAALGLCG